MDSSQERGDAVLVTRPEGQADGLCGALADAGFRPVHRPLLAVFPVMTLGDEQRRIVHGLDSYDHCLFVSGNAARFGLGHLLATWPDWPQRVQCYAVGDSTAAVLRDAGLSVQTPGADMSSEGLLALPALQAVADRRVLIVKGEGGRTALREALLERGAHVDELRCYRRAAPEADPRSFQELLRTERVGHILVSSGEALENLMALLPPDAGRASTTLRSGLVVPSGRVAEQARLAGWCEVVVAENASDGAMLAALQQSMRGREAACD